MTLALGVLLLGSLALVGDAKAQTSPIDFGDEGDQKRWLEGDDVRIRIDAALVNEGDEVTVTCTGGCPPGDISYTHTLQDGTADDDEGHVIVFFANEDFFTTAHQDGQPRWNGTWEVTVDTGTGTYSQEFEVYLADEFEAPNDHYQPTVDAHFQASGYPKLTSLNFTVYHAPEDGDRTQVWTKERNTGSNRSARVEWQIPPSVTSHLDCPNQTPAECRNFEVEVVPDQGDKGVEVASFRIDPATIQVGEGVADQPPDNNRTQELLANIPLVYQPSALEGDPVKVGPQESRGGVENISVHLQRLPDGDTCGGSAEPVNVTTVTGPWNPVLGFVPSYTTSRDLPLSTAGSPDQFRWAVAKQEDRYGNPIRYEPLTCFPINPYEMVPDPVDIPDEFERKKDESFVLNFSYANGAPLTEGDNATQMEGVLRPAGEDGDLSDVDKAIPLVGEHLEGGLWSWTHKLDRDFEHLGPWRFEFCGAPSDGTDCSSTEDEWGNEIQTEASDVFEIKPASPRIDLKTSVDGEFRNASEGFNRGEEVDMVATTTYPDGEPIDEDLLDPNLSGELPVRIFRKGPDGGVDQITEMGLREISSLQGKWRGSFEIPLVSSGAPLGNWDIEVTVRDNVTSPTPDDANENVTRFDRPVGPDVLQVSTDDAPRRDVLAGQSVTWSFVVRDSAGNVVTDERTGDKDSGTITVDVREWDNGKPGAFVASGLEPNYDPERGSGAWVMTWTPPKSLQPGEHVFSPNGTDIHDNPLADRARSRPFDVSIERVPRDTIVDPPLAVERGQNVTVVFDGRDGDTGRNGSEHPTIRLERDTGDGRWVVEEPDLRRENRTGAGDHLATWTTTTSTPEADYRFRISGRAPDGSIIDATSDPFAVRPQDVTRPVLEPVVPFAKKGTTVTGVVARENFDTLQPEDIRISGPQNITDAPGERAVETNPTNWTVSWTIPVTVPRGEYVMHVRGEDQFGNNVTAKLGPVRAGPVNLTVEPIKAPPPEVPRTDVAELVFRVTYPDDTLMEAVHGRPDVVVAKGDSLVTEANLTFDGVNWHARYVPPPDAERTSYAFQIGGRDKANNDILEFDSRDFRVATGTIDRTVRDAPPQSPTRLDEVTIQVEADPDDRFIDFELEHYGEVSPDQAPGPDPPEPQFTGRLSHEYRPSLAVYEITWTPPRDQDVGWYVVTMSGQDPNGNSLAAETEPFRLSADRLDTRWIDRIDEVTPGSTERYRLEIQYSNGDPMTDQDGAPDTFVHLNQRPVEPRPDVRYDPEEELWIAEWTFPEELPPGGYNLVARGSDAYGNEIPTTATTPFLYEPGTLNQLTGATVPGPGAALAAFAVAVTGLAYGRVLSRR